MIDLEQQIMECWSIVDDLDYVAELTEYDANANIIVLAIQNLYRAKFEKLWEVFEESIKK